MRKSRLFLILIVAAWLLPNVHGMEHTEDKLARKQEWLEILDKQSLEALLSYFDDYPLLQQNLRKFEKKKKIIKDKMAQAASPQAKVNAISKEFLNLLISILNEFFVIAENIINFLNSSTTLSPLASAQIKSFEKYLAQTEALLTLLKSLEKTGATSPYSIWLSSDPSHAKERLQANIGAIIGKLHRLERDALIDSWNTLESQKTVLLKQEKHGTTRIEPTLHAIETAKQQTLAEHLALQQAGYEGYEKKARQAIQKAAHAEKIKRIASKKTVSAHKAKWLEQPKEITNSKTANSGKKSKRTRRKEESEKAEQPKEMERPSEDGPESKQQKRFPRRRWWRLW